MERDGDIMKVNVTTVFSQIIYLFISGLVDYYLSAFVVAQDVTEEEQRIESEKKQTQILQYVFGASYFSSVFKYFFSMF